jgi:succinate dehydrogenase/fumarate reductase flavoprotein subunit
VQAEVFPYERNWTRRADLLEDSLQRLDAQWARVRHASAPSPQQAVRAREAVAMLATSRWMYRSALQRTETRGMARRQDHAGLDLGQRHRLVSGGLDEVWVRPQTVRPPVNLDLERLAA